MIDSRSPFSYRSLLNTPAPRVSGIERGYVTLALTLFALLCLIPGLLFVHLFADLASLPKRFRIVFGFCFGIALSGVLSTVLYLLKLDAPVLLGAYPVLVAILLFVSLLKRRRRGAPKEEDLYRVRTGFTTRHATILVVVLGALAALCAYSGPLVNYRSDSYDHLNTIRRIEETGSLFPTSSFHKGDVEIAPDPRKGSYHSLLAIVCLGSSTEPFEVWRLLPALLAPFLVLAASVFAEQLFQSASKAILAAGLFVLTYGGMFPNIFKAAGLPLEVGMMLFWTSLCLLFLYMNSRRPVYMILGSFLAASIVSVHIYPFFQLSLAILFCFLCSLFARGAWHRTTTAFLRAGLLIIAFSLPFLLFRFLVTYTPVNPIHLSMMGVLELGKNLAVANPLTAYHEVGPLGLLSLVFIWKIGRGARENDAALYMLAALCAPLCIGFNPILVPLIEPSYLATRTFRLLPYFLIGAWVLWEYLKPGGGHRLLSWRSLVAMLVLVALVTYLPLRWQGYRPRGSSIEVVLSPLPWRAAFEQLDAQLPQGQVVLSDPVTSYCLSAFTSQYVVCTLDQHSSPNDARAIERIADAQVMLSPYSDAERTQMLLEKHDVDYILINHNFRRTELGYQWAVFPRQQHTIDKRFGTLVPMLKKELELDGFTLYRVDRDSFFARDARAIEIPFLSDAPDSVLLSSPILYDSSLALVGFSLVPDTVAAGDTVSVDVYLRLARPPAAEAPWHMVVRLDNQDFKGALYAEAYGKPYRKLQERIANRKHRIRVLRHPTEGLFPIVLWPGNGTVKDGFSIPVPRSAHPGEYHVKFQLLRQPFYVNIRLQDLLYNKDLYEGPTVATVHIVEPQDEM
jgi:hypothetical protein